MRFLAICLGVVAMAITPAPAFADKKDNPKYDRAYDPFFEDPVMASVALSPDGTHVAMAQRQGDDQFLIIRSLEDPNAKPAGLKVGDELEIQWITWANDDRIIYSLFRPWDGGLTSRPVIRMYGIDRDGQNNMQFFRNNKRINENPLIRPPVSTLPNDPDHIMVPVRLGEDLDVLRVNVNDGKFKLAAQGKETTARWFTDINGNAAFYAATRDDGQIVDYYARIPGTNGKDAKFRLAKTVRRDTTSNSTILDFQPVGPAPNPNHYYVIARPNGANYAGVHLYDFEQDTYLQPMFQPEGGEVIQAFADPSTGEYFGATYLKDGRQAYAMGSKLQAHMNGLEKYFGESLVPLLVSASADLDKMIFLATGPGEPGSYHLYDVGRAYAEELGQRMPSLTAAQIGVGEVITYKARDGLDIHGYLSRPASLGPKEKAPMIVYVHGGPEARTDFGYKRNVAILNWLGYQVFEPNFRGSTGRGMEFADMGRRQWGKAMQNDVDDGFAHLVKMGLVDQDQACIMGFSYGGYSALAAATLTPGKYQCVIAGAAPADLIEMLRSEKRGGEFGYNYWTRHIGDMNADASQIVTVSPAQLASRIEDPLLLIHGTRDTIVPFEQGEIMRDAMKAAGKPVTWIPMNRIGHSYPREKDDVRNAFYDGLLEFLGEHLPVEG
ncbi:MAG: S9 family peptidase [Litorimonas sp.]